MTNIFNNKKNIWGTSVIEQDEIRANEILQCPRLTTTQRDALTPENGFMIYNTTINEMEVYENGAWVVISTGGGGGFMDLTTNQTVTSGIKTFNEDIIVANAKMYKCRNDFPLLDIHGLQYIVGSGTLENIACVGAVPGVGQEIRWCTGYWNNNLRSSGTFNERASFRYDINANSCTLDIDNKSVLKNTLMRLHENANTWETNAETVGQLNFKYNTNDRMRLTSSGNLSLLGATNLVVDMQGSNSSVINLVNTDIYNDLDGQMQLRNNSNIAFAKFNGTNYRCAFGENPTVSGANIVCNFDSGANSNQVVRLPLVTTVGQPANGDGANYNGSIWYNTNLNEPVMYIDGASQVLLHSETGVTLATNQDITAVHDNLNGSIHNNIDIGNLDSNTIQSTTGDLNLNANSNIINLNSDRIIIENGNFIRLRNDALVTNPHIHGLSYEASGVECVCIATSDAVAETRVVSGYWTSDNKANAWVEKGGFAYTNVANSAVLRLNNRQVLTDLQLILGPAGSITTTSGDLNLDAAGNGRTNVRGQGLTISQSGIIHSSGYELSLKGNTNFSYLEIKNGQESQTNDVEGMFFGSEFVNVSQSDFALYNWSAGDITFYVSTIKSSGDAKMAIERNGVFRVHDLTAGTVKTDADGRFSSLATTTGYTNAMTGTADRATAYDTSTITLQQLAERVKALQDDLTTRGEIGA